MYENGKRAVLLSRVFLNSEFSLEKNNIFKQKNSLIHIFICMLKAVYIIKSFVWQFKKISNRFLFCILGAKLFHSSILIFIKEFCCESHTFMQTTPLLLLFSPLTMIFLICINDFKLLKTHNVLCAEKQAPGLKAKW